MLELRRRLLKGSSSAALLAPLLGSGLLKPATVLAGDWNADALTARTIDQAVKAYGAEIALEARDVTINSPEVAENGAKVEIEVISNLADTRSIAIFAERNPMPLTGIFEFSGPALPYVRAQLKLAETTRIRAVARTGDGNYHVAFRDIKVTIGGCGA